MHALVAVCPDNTMASDSDHLTIALVMVPSQVTILAGLCYEVLVPCFMVKSRHKDVSSVHGILKPYRDQYTHKVQGFSTIILYNTSWFTNQFLRRITSIEAQLLKLKILTSWSVKISSILLGTLCVFDEVTGTLTTCIICMRVEDSAIRTFLNAGITIFITLDELIAGARMGNVFTFYVTAVQQVWNRWYSYSTIFTLDIYLEHFSVT